MTTMNWPYMDRPEAVCWSLVGGRWWRVDGGSEIAMRISCARRIEASRGVVSEWNRRDRKAPGARFEVTVGAARRPTISAYQPPVEPN